MSEKILLLSRSEIEQVLDYIAIPEEYWDDITAVEVTVDSDGQYNADDVRLTENSNWKQSASWEWLPAHYYYNQAGF